MPLARVLSKGGCIYSFEINKGKDKEAALRKSEAILNLVKLPSGIEMTEERLEILTETYPQYYLNMFEKLEKAIN